MVADIDQNQLQNTNRWYSKVSIRWNLKWDLHCKRDSLYATNAAYSSEALLIAQRVCSIRGIKSKKHCKRDPFKATEVSC